MEQFINQDWYVIQVYGGSEFAVDSRLQTYNLSAFRPYTPKKKMEIRKAGKRVEKYFPFYPGYVFLTGKWDLQEARVINDNPKVIRFLGGMTSPKMITSDEKALITKICGNGCVNYSRVIKEGTKIRVVDGPLKYLEGYIESVDSRKRRVFVQLPLAQSSLRVSMGIELVDKASH